MVSSEENDLIKKLREEVNKMLIHRDLYWISDVPKIRSIKRLNEWINETYFGSSEEYYICFDPISYARTSIQIYDGYDEDSRLGILNILEQLKKGNYPCIISESGFTQLRVYRESRRMQHIFRCILSIIEQILRHIEISEPSFDENYEIEFNSPDVDSDTLEDHSNIYHINSETFEFFETPESFMEDSVINHFRRMFPTLRKSKVKAIVNEMMKEE